MGDEKKHKSKSTNTNQRSIFEDPYTSFLNPNDTFIKPTDQLKSKRRDSIGGMGAVADIFFKTSETSLDGNDKKILDSVSADLGYELLGNKAQIYVEGFADYRGSEKSNKGLAYLRAAEVAFFLQDKLSKTSSNFNIDIKGHGEEKGNKGLASQRRASIFISFPDKKQPKKPDPKPKKTTIVEVPLPKEIKPGKPKGMERKKNVVEDSSTGAALKGGTSLANNLAGGTALGGAIIIGLQVKFIYSSLKILGEDPNKMNAAIVGAAYGKIIAAYNAAKVYSIFKDDKNNPPSKIMEVWKSQKPSLPSSVTRSATFYSSYNSAYDRFKKKAVDAFKAHENKFFNHQDTLAGKRRAMSKLNEAAEAIQIMNIVSKKPSEVLQSTCEAYVANELAAKHNNFYMLIKDAKYTYPFE